MNKAWVWKAISTILISVGISIIQQTSIVCQHMQLLAYKSIIMYIIIDIIPNTIFVFNEIKWQSKLNFRALFNGLNWNCFIFFISLHFEYFGIRFSREMEQKPNKTDKIEEINNKTYIDWNQIKINFFYLFLLLILKTSADPDDDCLFSNCSGSLEIWYHSWSWWITQSINWM